MQTKSLPLKKQAIAKAFATAAATYDQAAFIEQEIGTRLLDRLAALNLDPRHILDLGCGTGYITKHLHNMFPNATIVGLDLAWSMANFARHANNLSACCADAETLPFANQQFDLLFSNCCFNYVENLPALFTELKRVLSINGALLFTTLGSATLHELHLDGTLPDMHVIGDLLLQLGYKNPVVDTENIKFTYKQLQTLLMDLQQSGTYAIDLQHADNLTDPCIVTFETIFGIAFQQKNKQQTDKFGNTYIAIDEIEYMIRGC